MHVMIIKHDNTGEKQVIHWGRQMSCYNSAGETNVLEAPLGKARLCWGDGILVGKETSLGKTLRVREVIATSFTGDEKRGSSSFTGDEKVCIRMPIIC